MVYPIPGPPFAAQRPTAGPVQPAGAGGGAGHVRRRCGENGECFTLLLVTEQQAAVTEANDNSSVFVFFLLIAMNGSSIIGVAI